MAKLSARDTVLATLRAKYPDWYIWRVDKARDRSVWYAGRPANLVATYEAHSAEELDVDLRNGQG